MQRAQGWTLRENGPPLSSYAARLRSVSSDLTRLSAAIQRHSCCLRVRTRAALTILGVAAREKLRYDPTGNGRRKVVLRLGNEE